MLPPPSSLRDEIRRLERLREEDPGGLAFARLGEAYRAAGRYELALEVLEEGIREGPSHPAGHLVMARVHHDLEDPVRERRALEKALEVDPGNGVARRAMEELGPGDGSDPDDRDRAGSETPISPDQTGVQGDPGSGGEERRRASHSPEEREELLAQLHRVSREDWWEGEPDGGAPGEQASDDADDDGVVTETMGHLYARQGLWDEAETVYRRLARAAPDRERLARCLEQVREREVPEAPPGRGPEQRPPNELPDGRSEPAPEVVDDQGLTMRAHLRSLLRGGGVRPAGEGSTLDGKVGRRTGERQDDDAGMEELLRRWRRAARKEEGQ